MVACTKSYVLLYVERFSSCCCFTSCFCPSPSLVISLTCPSLAFHPSCVQSVFSVFSLFQLSGRLFSRPAGVSCLCHTGKLAVWSLVLGFCPCLLPQFLLGFGYWSSLSVLQAASLCALHLGLLNCWSVTSVRETSVKVFLKGGLKQAELNSVDV